MWFSLRGEAEAEADLQADSTAGLYFWTRLPGMEWTRKRKGEQERQTVDVEVQKQWNNRLEFKENICTMQERKQIYWLLALSTAPSSYPIPAFRLSPMNPVVCFPADVPVVSTEPHGVFASRRAPCGCWHRDVLCVVHRHGDGRCHGNRHLSQGSSKSEIAKSWDLIFRHQKQGKIFPGLPPLLWE